MSEKKMILYSLLFTVLIFVIGILTHYFVSIVFLVIFGYLVGLLWGYVIGSEISNFDKKSSIKKFILANLFLLVELLLIIPIYLFPEVAIFIIGFLIIFYMIFLLLKTYNEP